MVDQLPAGELAERIVRGTLKALPGIGEATAQVINRRWGRAGVPDETCLAGHTGDPVGPAGGVAG